MRCMSPRRFAVFVLVLLLPAMLWGFAWAGKEDLLLKTRSLMGQAKKNRPGVRDGFVEQFRVPVEDPDAAAERLLRLWRIFQACTPTDTRYGSQAPVRLGDGKEREHRQVVVRGKNSDGQPVEVHVEWIRHAGAWYIHDFSGWEPPAPLRSQHRAVERPSVMAAP